MPLQVRRGTNAQRQAMTEPLASGELLYATDTGTLYIGNGSTLGGIAVANTSSQDIRDISSSLFTSGTHSGISFTYDGSVIDAVVDPDLSNYQGLIRANSLQGTLVGDDSTILVDAVSNKIQLDGTVKGNIVPDANQVYDIGSDSFRFRDLYLSGTSIDLGGAIITSPDGSTVNLPAGSTVGGVAIGSGESGGLIPGSNYNINIVSDDSTVMVDTATTTLRATVTFTDLIGSVFGQDSGTIIDATDNSVYCNNVTITGAIKSPDLELDIVHSDPTQSVKIRRFIPVAGNHTDYYTVTDGAYSSGNNLYLSRGTLESPTTLQIGDVLNSDITFGHDGTDYIISTIIASQVDPGGVVTTGSVPGTIAILTLTDGNPLNGKGVRIDSRGFTSVNLDTQPQATLDVNGFAKLAILDAAPATPADGMVAIADGDSVSGWDPLGLGAPAKQQMVVYLGGAWRQIAIEP